MRPLRFGTNAGRRAEGKAPCVSAFIVGAKGPQRPSAASPDDERSDDGRRKVRWEHLGTALDALRPLGYERALDQLWTGVVIRRVVQHATAIGRLAWARRKHRLTQPGPRED